MKRLLRRVRCWWRGYHTMVVEGWCLGFLETYDSLVCTWCGARTIGDPASEAVQCMRQISWWWRR